MVDVVTEALDFEEFLALQKRLGITPKPRDEGFASGQLIQSGSQLGDGRARPGSPGRAMVQQLIGPLDEAVEVHETGFGRRFRRGETS